MPSESARLISVAEAAQRLGVTRGRIAQLIGTGRLPATKVGRVFVIVESDLEPLENRKPGRPKNSVGENGG